MHRPRYTAIVAHLSLAVALGGGAAAAVTVNGASIKAGTVTGTTVKDGSLTGSDLKKHSVPLDRLSTSLRLQYWNRAASDARYLPIGGTAASALTARSAATASIATNAVNATNSINAINATTAVNAANATNAAQLGGVPAAAFGTTAVSSSTFSLVGAIDSPIWTSDGVTAYATFCGASTVGFAVVSGDLSSVGWFSINGGAPSVITNGSDVGSNESGAAVMTLHLVRGTGSSQTVIDLSAYASPAISSSCPYVTEVTTHTG